MALGTPVVTLHSSDGQRIPRLFKYLAQDSEEMSRVHRTPQVSGYITTSASESGQIIDLTDQGFEFLADNEYRVTLVGRHSNDTIKWRQVWTQIVQGNDGTTPILRGDPRLVEAVGRSGSNELDYGLVHAQATYSTDTATAVAANSSNGCSVGNNTTNTITFTHPVARAAPKLYWLSVSPDVADVAEQLHASGPIAATATTASIFLADLATPSADGFDDAGTLTAFAKIVPPPSVDLVMNSNNVEVHVGYDASDLVQHYVDVYVERSEYLPFGA